MKRLFNGAAAHRMRWLAPIMASSVLLAACGGGGGDSDEIELVFNSFIPESSHLSQAAAAWLDEVEKKSDGRITFQRHWGGALAEVTEANDAMGQGRIDVGLNSLAYEPDQFWLTESLLKVPFQATDMAATAAAITQLNAETPEATEEFSKKNLKVLTPIPTSSLLLGTKDKQIKTSADLKGMSIRGAGGASPIDAAIKAAGAEAVAMPVSELYTSLQRGVVGGQMTFGFLDGPAYSMEEVIKEWVDPGFGSFAAPFMLMNAESYDKLPDDLKKIVDEASANVVPNYLESILPPAAEEACKVVKDNDVNLTVMSEADQKAWADLWLDDYLTEWKAEIAKRNIDGDEYLAAFQAALKDNATDSEPLDAFLGCKN